MLKWTAPLICLSLLVTTACFGPRQIEPAFSGQEPLQVIQMLAKEKQFLPPLLKAKALRQTRLEITSLDSDYDFQAPELGIGLISIPANSTTRVYFTPQTVGLFNYNSTASPDMKGIIDVQYCPPATFQTNPVEATPDSIAKGKAAFLSNCVSCHGVSGRGDGPAAVNPGNKPIDLTQPYMKNESDGEMFAIISDGWYGMVAFRDTLGEEDRWNVVNYVRTLSAK